MTRTDRGPSDLSAADLEVLALLQANARLSNASIARQLGVATSTVFERIRRLETRGVIQRYEARIAPDALHLGVTAFVLIAAIDVASEGAVEAALLAMPEVLELHKIAGEDAFLAKIRAEDNTSLGKALRDGVERVGVRSIRTAIVLATSREGFNVPPLAADRPA